jgi:hypothetical protein
MVHESDQLSDVGFAAQVDRALESGVVMTLITDLDELNSPAKVIHDLLITIGTPPFDGHVVLAASRDDPKRDFLACQFPDLRIPGLFQFGNVDISFEDGGLNVQLEPLVQKLSETMETMIGNLVASIDQWIFTFQDSNFRIFFIERGEIRIILP